MQTAKSLREAGNKAFKAKNWKEADQCYSKAIAIIESVEKADCEGIKDALEKCEAHKLYSNRSAARLKLGQKDAALADAVEGCRRKPKWTKIYHRQALALLALGRAKDACAAYTEALGIDPDSDFMKKCRAKALAKVPAPAPAPVPAPTTPASKDDFIAQYRALGDIRLRLATLAAFWNRSKRTERLRILRALIALITRKAPGSEPVKKTMAKYTKDNMQRLPMQNYEDLTIPEVWVLWFGAVSSDEKVAVLTAMWNGCTDTERQLIVKDMQAFFGAGAGSQAVEKAASVPSQ